MAIDPGDGGHEEGDRGGRTAPAELAGLGVQMVVTVLALLFLGRWLDGRLGTDPWLMLAGALLGLVLAFGWLFRRILDRPSGPRR